MVSTARGNIVYDAILKLIRLAEFYGAEALIDAMQRSKAWRDRKEAAAAQAAMDRYKRRKERERKALRGHVACSGRFSSSA
jgi:hypothetical protein